LKEDHILSFISWCGKAFLVIIWLWFIALLVIMAAT